MIFLLGHLIIDSHLFYFINVVKEEEDVFLKTIIIESINKKYLSIEQK